jgi:hypothetical protein
MSLSAGAGPGPGSGSDGGAQTQAGAGAGAGQLEGGAQTRMQAPRVMNLMGSHGSEAVAMALVMGIRPTVVDISEGEVPLLRGWGIREVGGGGCISFFCMQASQHLPDANTLTGFYAFYY